MMHIGVVRIELTLCNVVSRLYLSLPLRKCIVCWWGCWMATLYTVGDILRILFGDNHSMASGGDMNRQ